MGMKFDFTARATYDGIKYVPLVDVLFTNPETSKSLKIECRIDSGADEIILPAEVGIRVGIKLETGERLEFQGFTQNPVAGYRHKVEMQILGDDHTYTVPCSFVFGVKTTGLLGIRGLFDSYKVTFDLGKKQFELESISEK
jgi:hypothetical protein